MGVAVSRAAAPPCPSGGFALCVLRTPPACAWVGWPCTRYGYGFASPVPGKSQGCAPGQAGQVSPLHGPRIRPAPGSTACDDRVALAEKTLHRLGPSPSRGRGAHTGVAIETLRNYGPFRARFAPGAGWVHRHKGGVSPSTLCTVARPSPGAFPLSRQTHCSAEPSGQHEPGQVEHAWCLPRDEALLGRIARMVCGSRCVVPGVAGPMMGEAGTARQARGWLPGVLARSPTARRRTEYEKPDGGERKNLTFARDPLG